MDKVQPITRRAALVGALVSSAAIAVPASALSAHIDSPALVDLVAERARLYDEMILLLDAEAEAETRYRKTLSPLVPLTLPPSGRRVSGSLELRLFGRDHVAAEIRKTHAELIELHCTRFREDIAPGAAAETRAALRKSQAKCMRALNAAVKEEQALKDGSGYSEAWTRSRAASMAEIAACRAIFAYVPRTTAEAQAKVEWMREKVADRDLEADEMEALFGSIANAVLA